jgi:hypothetical protein
MSEFKIGDIVFVIDWGKHYSDIEKYNYETQLRENIFPIKTEIPRYSGIDSHWDYHYEPNLTLKGTVNKRDPQKLVGKTARYINYKWEVVEIFKHPNAGEYCYKDEEQRKKWNYYHKVTEENLLLLASTHTEKEWMRCYIVIEDSGVSNLTPQQVADKKFNGLIEANLGKWDRLKINRDNVKQIPKSIISIFYDEDDKVLFGSNMTRGLVEYKYLDSKFSIDKKPIFLYSSINYDGKGISQLSEEQRTSIKSYNYINNYFKE